MRKHLTKSTFYVTVKNNSLSDDSIPDVVVFRTAVHGRHGPFLSRRLSFLNNKVVELASSQTVCPCG